MSLKKYRCSNIGNCFVADSRSSVYLAADVDKHDCRECGRELVEVGGESAVAKQGGNKTIVLALAILAVLAVVGAYFFLSGSKAPTAPVAVAPSGAPAQPPVAVAPAPPAPAQPVAPVQPAPPAPVQQAAPAIAPVKADLRLHGSNTIGAKMAPMLVDAFLKKEGASEVRVIPGEKQEESILRATFPNGRIVHVEIFAHGSTTAFKDLAVGACDIGMSSRRIKKEEVDSLKEAGLGDLTSPNSEHVVGLDGIAVIVNRNNPVQALTTEQIAALFSGKIKDWSEIKGGPKGAVTLYARDDKSGTFDTFQSLVLRKDKLREGAFRFEDSNELSDRVSSDLLGVGFIGLPYVRSSRSIEVSEGDSPAILPSFFTVSREDYPISRRLFLYTPEAPKNQLVPRFIEFAMSRKGQDLVRESGFVDQNVVLEAREQPKGAAPGAPLDEYDKLTQGAVQLSSTFRFAPGGDRLDNKALRDLDRVVDILKAPEYINKELILIGFTDNKGPADANIALSKARANQIAEQLKKRGIQIKTVEGLGPVRPVASNANDDGREKNRRVEIWVRARK
jgi:phosphate transport system substrate-binding protein